MWTEDVVGFKEYCTKYLEEAGLNQLRVYGRYVGLRTPTVLKKKDLIKEIVAMICGETKPCHTNRGQPVKEQVIDWDFFNKIEQVRGEYAARERFIRLNNLQVEDGEKLG